jgi:hypothetical protein
MESKGQLLKVNPSKIRKKGLLFKKYFCLNINDDIVKYLGLVKSNDAVTSLQQQI